MSVLADVDLVLALEIVLGLARRQPVFNHERYAVTRRVNAHFKELPSGQTFIECKKFRF
jgi:alpha-D-ribose 1-methylphosphonate 5-triphosphate synthase subunit PhnI